MAKINDVLLDKNLKPNAKLVYVFIVQFNKTGLTISDIAEQLNLSFPAVSTSLADLVDHSYINREDTQIAGHRGLRPVFTIL